MAAVSNAASSGQAHIADGLHALLRILLDTSTDEYAEPG